jgi:YVTN family beta-propeller protein
MRNVNPKARILFVLAAAAILIEFSTLPAGSETAAGYRIIQKVPVGGDGGWDYLVLDAAARRLYVTRATRVLVFDADTLKPVGEIPDTAGVHGVAIAPELGRGYTSNGRASSVTVFDLKTLKTLAEVKVTGDNPDAILYDPATKKVFAFNGRSANVTVLDAATDRVLKTIPLGGKPEFATTDLEGHVYVNIEDKSEVVELDSRNPGVENVGRSRPAKSPPAWQSTGPTGGSSSVAATV